MKISSNNKIKYAIVTPTYINHFRYIDNYLKSFVKFVEDKNIPIYFTISKSEENSFEKIISKYKNILNINILFIDNLFVENNIKETPNEYLNKYGRFTFQTAKKFYSMLHINAEKFLILDSESMWIRKTNMSKIFSDYFAKPFIAVSDIDNVTRQNQAFNTMLNNIYEILNIPPSNKWFIEHFMWYYDKNILLDMFKTHGSLANMLETLVSKNYNLQIDKDIKFGIFEIVLYYAYLYNNAQKYGYLVLNLNDVMKKYMTNREIQNYYNHFINELHGCCGLLEHTLILINEHNYKKFISIFSDLNFNIIRCDKSDLKNYDIQNKFINSIQPNILAASQEHAFGLDNGFIKLKIKSYWKKLHKHGDRIAYPLKSALRWFSEIFSFFSYSLKLISLYLKLFSSKLRF